MEHRLRDPISSLTHFIAFLAAIPLLFIMTSMAHANGGTKYMVGFVVFGVSLLLLYGTSAFYHAVRWSDHAVATLRRIDHMMIFILIAGTYTPICLLALPYPWGKILLISVWSFAIAGIFLKIFWMEAPRWLYTLIYVVMGWLVVIAFVPLKQAIPTGGLALLAAGGVIYTVGAVIYATKAKMFEMKRWNFHDIFHLFVIGGSVCHILFMFLYIL